jgi:glucose-1-phosphate adenylyltransferase
MGATDDILAVILGGGRGARLYPLTKERSKPAVPMAGKYRLIDIPISNCINSGIYHIAVLTQFNSVSLHRHISRTYNFDAFHSGWVQIWAAEQTLENTNWYQGTADAVRKQLLEISSARTSHVLILAGDHLYRMDYAKMAEFHLEKDADITVAVQPVSTVDCQRFGILKRTPNCQITDFHEKPTDPEVLKDIISRDDPARPYLGSMGIYLFKTKVLQELLENERHDDFGSHVIPTAIRSHLVYGYDFHGFWEDIGTIRSFYQANLALTDLNPPFNFYDQNFPIYSHPRFLPGSNIEDTIMKNVLIAEGCRIEKATLIHSIIGLRSQIRGGTTIIDSILMGNDYYEKPGSPEAFAGALEIGFDCYIEGAIVDKNARINKGTIIKPFPVGTDIDGDGWLVRDGIVIIPKSAVIPPGTEITP